MTNEGTITLLTQALQGLLPLACTEQASLEELAREDASYHFQAELATKRIEAARIALWTAGHGEHAAVVHAALERAGRASSASA